MREPTDTKRDVEDTLERLKGDNLSRDAIALLVARLIELENPGRKVEFESDASLKISDPDGSSFTMNLHNLWAECEREPDERAEIVSRYVRILVSRTEGTKPSIVLENIVALVRDSVYRAYVAEDDRALVTRHLIGDLWIVYAVDLPESTDVLGSKEAESLSLGPDELLRLGTENIGRLLGQMEWEPYGECFSLSCEDITYASSALLLDHVWEHTRSIVSGDPAVAVPARDTVLVTGSENRAGLKELRDEIEYITKNGHHIVSETLLRWRNGVWELYS
jgi:uncharacterized protein YtpQ (UPF0354 family)